MVAFRDGSISASQPGMHAASFVLNIKLIFTGINSHKWSVKPASIGVLNLTFKLTLPVPAKSA